ncbi:MAG TPA: LD-carboxypeptidase, partial [Candidatus Eisenbergiella intestinigallinarum]|nr:LD-carboxypeptidase [Candidatus Eisenbergiella intestinigallinarum]
QKSRMEGVVAGGNLRCLLKLAGTEFWPDMRGKLLLLEGFSGGETMIASGLAQLEQMGVFRQVSGLLLGTFTELEGSVPDAEERLAALVRAHVGSELPVAKTQRIGHGTDSAAVLIGGQMCLEERPSALTDG